jgi:transaldolase
MPESTLRAFGDHGHAMRTIDTDPARAHETLRQAADAGVDLEVVTRELERDGVEAFCDSYEQLLSCVQSKLSAVAVG